MFYFMKYYLYRFLFVIGMLFSLVGDITLFFYNLFLVSFYKYYVYVVKNTLLQHLIDLNEFEQFYSNSGYWDFVLLSVYDYYFRFICVYSLFTISDFSLVERASWRVGYNIIAPLVKYCLYSEVKTFSELFGLVLFNLLCFISLCIITYIFLILYV